MNRQEERENILRKMLFQNNEIILHEYQGYIFRVVVDIFNDHMYFEYEAPNGFIYPVDSEEEYLDVIEEVSK